MTKELSEKEVGKIANRTVCGVGALNNWDHTSAKHQLMDFARAILERFGGCSPEEKREAEREAAKWAVALGYAGNETMVGMRRSKEVLAAIDRRYPKLPPEPPTVTLSEAAKEFYQVARNAMGAVSAANYREVCEEAEGQLDAAYDKFAAILKTEEQAK